MKINKERVIALKLNFRDQQLINHLKRVLDKSKRVSMLLSSKENSLKSSNDLGFIASILNEAFDNKIFEFNYRSKLIRTSNELRLSSIHSSRKVHEFTIQFDRLDQTDTHISLPGQKHTTITVHNDIYAQRNSISTYYNYKTSKANPFIKIIYREGSETTIRLDMINKIINDAIYNAIFDYNRSTKKTFTGIRVMDQSDEKSFKFKVYLFKNNTKQIVIKLNDYNSSIICVKEFPRPI